MRVLSPKKDTGVLLIIVSFSYFKNRFILLPCKGTTFLWHTQKKSPFMWFFLATGTAMQDHHKGSWQTTTMATDVLFHSFNQTSSRFFAPRTLRYFPDTYPIHTRHIPDTYVYPMNTPRILRVYPMNTSCCTEPYFLDTLNSRRIAPYTLKTFKTF